MVSRSRLGRRLARLEGAVRTTSSTPPGVALVREILSQPDGIDRLADFAEILSLGRTIRELEERRSNVTGANA
jgi:hypothetical protein